MQGVLEVPELRGVIPCAFDHIFEHIGSKPTTKFLTRACYLEIYNEQVQIVAAVLIDYTQILLKKKRKGFLLFDVCGSCH